MNKVNAKRESKLHCPLEEDGNILFFSLMDYRNNYFTSNDPKKIIEFYNGFENRDQLIQWMRERPKAAHTIREVEGDKDIIVVIPTADFNGKFAKECRENIFNGLHIVFVESGVDNYYFNYAHNCNVGINKAMEYNPKWVVVSNDDMIKIDDVKILMEELHKLDNEDVSTVFTLPGSYHSIPVKFAEPRWVYYLYMQVKSTGKAKLYLWKKFKLHLFLVSTGFIWKILFRSGPRCYSIASFGIFSSIFLRKFTSANGWLYDETFQTGNEDIDLSLKLSLIREDFKLIDYQIGNYINRTLGSTHSKELRDILGNVLLHYLIFEGEDDEHKRIRKLIEFHTQFFRCL